MQLTNLINDHITSIFTYKDDQSGSASHLEGDVFLFIKPDQIPNYLYLRATA